MKTTTKHLAALCLGSAFASGAMAVDVPSGLIVNAGGLEWAWASPCAPSGGCGGTLTMHDGWNVAVSSQFASSFAGFADLSAKFLAGSKCASSYFDSGYSHCDNSNVDPSFGNVRVWNAPAAWGPNSSDGFAETFVTRPVPEPETYALMLAGLAALGIAARRRQRG